MGRAINVLIIVLGIGVFIPEVAYLLKDTHEDVERPWAWFMVWLSLAVTLIGSLWPWAIAILRRRR